MRTPSGTVSTYQQLHDAFTHITEQEAKATTPLPDIAPAAILQSIILYHISILLDVHFWIQLVNAYWILVPFN